MANILIVLPYSGRRFGGGVAVFNAEITKALKLENHDVKLLTMRLPDKLNPLSDEHGNAELLYIENDRTLQMVDPGGASGDEDRNLLYKLFNSEEVLLSEAVRTTIQAGAWSPDIIIGHSRFSGPAAILLREKWFKKAKAVYFVHSIPVEGSVLKGYEAYEEPITSEVALQKFEMEKAWMPRANLVVAVGPLIRAGVAMILQQAKSSVRVHECIGGVDTDLEPVKYEPKKTVDLLFLGRASAPIKGLEDLLLAALKLKDEDICIDVRYWDDRTYAADRTVNRQNVQEWVDGLLGDESKRHIRVNIKEKTTNVRDEVRTHHGLLMPSYIEHFGLVPFDALGHGIPVLVNEISGAGMFLGDETRFGKYGPPCVVMDFDLRLKRPLQPANFLVNVAKDAFDNRPDAWAKAIHEFAQNVPARFAGAHEIHRILKGFSWRDCAQGIIAGAAEDGDSLITVQGGNGTILKL
jgi:glycosyltransferase involved in cell wall biosynthesis